MTFESKSRYHSQNIFSIERSELIFLSKNVDFLENILRKFVVFPYCFYKEKSQMFANYFPENQHFYSGKSMLSDLRFSIERTEHYVDHKENALGPKRD